MEKDILCTVCIRSMFSRCGAQTVSKNANVPPSVKAAHWGCCIYNMCRWYREGEKYPCQETLLSAFAYIYRKSFTQYNSDKKEKKIITIILAGNLSLCSALRLI